ncbi:vascular endothelial growth factor receptor 3-like [Ruditapes philippinarum]|uniref:vascular endothelial growth factor receptor 3-like n=1 Tax=Ruditapes philippinarum TaxID=129788 RepID=UPI00295BB4AF|nr:vascular endothelial growth factor receptor 3-like [Ruditapes philippinarum]
MVTGDNLELKCKVSGYPTPIVSWFKDEKEIETTIRINILEYEGAMGKLLITSLEDEDEGIYKCLAKNEVVPFNADAKMTVRVDGKSSGNRVDVGAIVGHMFAALACVALIV